MNHFALLDLFQIDDIQFSFGYSFLLIRIAQNGIYLLILLIVLGIVRVPIADSAPLHWHVSIQDFSVTHAAVYAATEKKIRAKQIPNLGAICTIEKPEGGILSPKRIYLKITRQEHTIYICAAPFGSSYFMSLWLLESSSLLRIILKHIPLIGFLADNSRKRITFYRADTMIMFKCVVHAAFNEAVNEVTEGKISAELKAASQAPVLSNPFDRNR